MYQESDFYHDENGNYEFEITRFQLWLYMVIFGFPKNLNEKTDVYNNLACALAVRLYKGFVFDADKMENTINYLYETNDALRTIFSLKDNKIIQKVLLKYNYSIDVRETFGKTVEDRYADAVKQANKEAALPIVDFEKIQSKFVLFKIDENDYLFLTVQNHMISDGYSLIITLKKMLNYYEENKVFKQGGTNLEFTQSEIRLLKTDKGQEKIEKLRNLK